MSDSSSGSSPRRAPFLRSAPAFSAQRAQLDREKQLALYFRALASGDDDLVRDILQRAETDAELSAMIAQQHAYEDSCDAPDAAQQRDADARTLRDWRDTFRHRKDEP